MALVRIVTNWRTLLALGIVGASFAAFVGPAHAGATPSSRPMAVSGRTTSAPSIPTHLGVRWSNRAAGTGTATISWQAPKFDGNSAITGYSVTTGSLSCSVDPPLLNLESCSIDKLSAGKSHVFTVTATNAVGSSNASVTSNLSAEGQVINFAPLPDATYDLAAITLTAVATSGLPVSYTSAGACTVTDATLTYTGVGSCAVIAYQNGSTSFQAAAPVATYFQITPASAVLSVTGGTYTADGTEHPATVSVTPAVTGLAISYCLHTGPRSQTCSNTAPKQPGVYRVTVRLDNPDYVATPTSATITVGPPTAVLPPDIFGGGSGAGGTTVFSRYGVVVHTVGSGFTGGHTVNVGAVSEESLGTFTIPSGNNLTSWLDLLRGSSTSTVVVNANPIHATTPEELSLRGSVAFPYGGFSGAGDYEMIELQSTGFVPNTTVSVVLHSTPLVLTQSAANSSGVVTLYVPVPKSMAGQTHQMLLSGTYLVTTTTAGADGTAPVGVMVNRTLLHRLVPNASLVVVFSDALDPSIRSFNSISLPSEASLATYIKLNTPLHLPPYKPTRHPTNTMNKVTGAAAALSAAAAGIAAARAASSVGSAASVSHTVSVGARGADSLHRASTEGIEAVHHAHDSQREHVGDHSRTWQLPGYQTIDRLSITVPVALSRYSSLAAVTASDGGYWRAMFGSASLVFPALGAALGIAAVNQTNGYPLPPHLTLFLAITALGFLDATAGLAAASVSLVGAVLTGHIDSLNMVISGLLLATIWFGLPVMVKKVRPFLRLHPESFQDWWVRFGDYVVGALFAGYLSAKLVDSFSLVSNLRVGIIVHGSEVGWVVAGVALFRYLVTTGVVYFYPKRMATITPVALPNQEDRFLATSIAIRLFFAALIFTALLGRTWIVAPLVALMAVGMWTRSHERHRRVSDWLYRMIPRNVGKILVFEVVGTVATGVLITRVASPVWQIAGLLFVLIGIGLIVDSMAGAKGRDWPVGWATRLAGVGLVIVTVLQLTGHLIE